MVHREGSSALDLEIYFALLMIIGRLRRCFLSVRTLLNV